jgi:TetR/AcrR family transcriptional regulator
MSVENSSAVGTQALILEAAERRFASYGFAKVTMEEIAADAGLRKASLYYYFPTKDELFMAVIEPKHRQFQLQVERILEDTDSASARIESYVVARYEFFKSLLNLNIIDIHSMIRKSPGSSDIFSRYARQELQWLVKLFQSGRLTGEFEMASSRQVAGAFLQIMQGLRLRFVRESQGLHTTSRSLARFRRELALVTRIFLNGIGARSAGKVQETRSRPRAGADRRAS